MPVVLSASIAARATADLWRWSIPFAVGWWFFRRRCWQLSCSNGRCRSCSCAQESISVSNGSLHSSVCVEIAGFAMSRAAIVHEARINILPKSSLYTVDILRLRYKQKADRVFPHTSRIYPHVSPILSSPISLDFDRNLHPIHCVCHLRISCLLLFYLRI